MSLIGKIVTLFSDKEKTAPVFPRTKVNAVSDDDGVGLNVLLDNLQSATTDLQNSISTKASTAFYTGVFPVSNWIDSDGCYTQTIAINGVLETDNPFTDIDLSNAENEVDVIENWNLVGRVAISADNTVVAYCYNDKPEVDIPIILKVVR